MKKIIEATFTTAILFWSLTQTVPAVAENQRSATTMPRGYDAETLFLSAGAGVAILEGDAGAAVGIGALRRVAEGSQVFVGADLGLNFWNYGPTGAFSDMDVTGIQLLPTLIYWANLEEMRWLSPFVGVAVGPHLQLQDTTQATTGIRAAANTLKAEALVRGGFQTRLLRTVALSIELKAGVLGADVLLQPNASVVMAL